MFVKSIAVLAAIVASMFLAATASAGSAVVFNHGNNPGDTCSVSNGPSSYVGFVTLVTNDNGGVVHCTTKLVSGPGAQGVIKNDGFIAVFNSNVANFTAQL